jgi:FHS family L-fucose permease-like MFS transporter
MAHSKNRLSNTLQEIDRYKWMILGGAIVPPLQGAIGDISSVGLHQSYLLAAVCFAVLALLALKLQSVLKRQGLDFDAQVSGGGH